MARPAMKLGAVQRDRKLPCAPGGKLTGAAATLGAFIFEAIIGDPRLWQPDAYSKDLWKRRMLMLSKTKAKTAMAASCGQRTSNPTPFRYTLRSTIMK